MLNVLWLLVSSMTSTLSSIIARQILTDIHEQANREIFYVHSFISEVKRDGLCNLVIGCKKKNTSGLIYTTIQMVRLG